MKCTHYDKFSNKQAVVEKCKNHENWQTCFNDIFCVYNFDESPSVKSNECTHQEKYRKDILVVNSCKNISIEKCR